MKIVKIRKNRKRFLPLLLLADEDESMVYKYIDKGTMYVLYDNGLKAECIATDEGDGIVEIKNLATAPRWQGHGYGRTMVEFITEKYSKSHSILQVGTGESPKTIPFYEKCGFVYSHRIPNFFIDNYSHEIYECGKMLTDMIVLRKKL